MSAAFRIRSRGHGMLATASLAVAALSAFSALTPPIAARVQLLESLEPESARAVAQSASLLGAVALALLAPGLARGSRRAAARTVAMLYLVAVTHAAKGLDLEEAALALGLALVVRGRLRPGAAEEEPGPAARAAAVALAAVAGAFALEVGALFAAGADLHLGTVLARAALGLFDGAHLRPAPRAFALGADGLLILAVTAGARVLVAPLAAARAREGHSAAAHARAAVLVGRWEDSLAPFALRRDRSFFFAAGAVVAYRTIARTAVVGGDPIGPPGSAGPALAAFRAWAEARGWGVVVTAAGGGRLEEYRRLGFSVLRIGSESVVDPAGFSLEGRRVRKLRQSVTRLRRLGWTVERVRTQALTAEQRAGIVAADAAWRRRQPRLAGWAMAMDRLWGAPEDATDLYVLGRDPAGAVRGFLRFLPYRDGLSLDAMRRPADAPNGFVEALVADALAHARETGVAEVSLNFAGFAHLMASEAALGRRQRLGRWLLRRVHGRFQLERLVAFNEKFGPRWRGRYLLHTGRTRLPLAALRVLQAEAYVRAPREPMPVRGAWGPEPEPVLAGGGVARA